MQAESIAGDPDNAITIAKLVSLLGQDATFRVYAQVARRLRVAVLRAVIVPGITAPAASGGGRCQSPTPS